jgi:catenin alpha
MFGMFIRQHFNMKMFVVSLQLPIVVWKMKAPEKKPLVRREKPEEVRAKVRRGSQKKPQNPIQALSEFQSPAEAV